MLHGMIAAPARPALETAGEARRRSLLAESDVLLDEVEALHLDDRTEAPQPLREAIRSLQIRLGRHDPPMPPATSAATATNHLFFIQESPHRPYSGAPWCPTLVVKNPPAHL